MKIFRKDFYCFFLSLFFVFYAKSVHAMDIIWLGRPVSERIDELIGFLLTIVSGLVFLVFIISGITYAFSAGNPMVAGKAKKIFITALIGIVLVLSSYSFIYLMNNILTN